jgi:hypothetical protein
MFSIKYLVFVILPLLTLSCTGRDHKPKHVQQTQQTNAATNSDTPVLDQTGLNVSSFDPCMDSIRKLLNSSSFLDIAKSLEMSWLTKNWKRHGRFMTEFNTDRQFIIHTYIEPDGPEMMATTIGWLRIDPQSRSFGFIDMSVDDNSKTFPIKCDTTLLGHIIDNCIDWTKK